MRLFDWFDHWLARNQTGPAGPVEYPLHQQPRATGPVASTAVSPVRVRGASRPDLYHSVQPPAYKLPPPEPHPERWPTQHGTTGGIPRQQPRQATGPIVGVQFSKPEFIVPVNQHPLVRSIPEPDQALEKSGAGETAPEDNFLVAPVAGPDPLTVARDISEVETLKKLNTAMLPAWLLAAPAPDQLAEIEDNVPTSKLTHTAQMARYTPGLYELHSLAAKKREA